MSRLSLPHAGMWALLLSNPKVLDDFGCMRWTVSQLVASLFPRRQPSPIRAVRGFMSAAAGAGLVEVYSVDGQDFAAVRNWCGVEPARRRYHRAPLPPSSTHVCGEHPCARTGARVAGLWREPFGGGSDRGYDRCEAREDDRLSVPSDLSEPFGPSENGCIDGRTARETAREKARARRCEYAGCRRLATGAAAGTYACAVHGGDGFEACSEDESGEGAPES